MVGSRGSGEDFSSFPGHASFFDGGQKLHLDEEILEERKGQDMKA